MQSTIKLSLCVIMLLVASNCIFAQKSGETKEIPKAAPPIECEALDATAQAADCGSDPQGRRFSRLLVRPPEISSLWANKEDILKPDKGPIGDTVDELTHGRNSQEPGNDVEQYQEGRRSRFAWRPALIQSGILLGIQHAFRFTEEKTRKNLGGKFFPDWGESVGNLRGWDDGGKFFTNYIAHPMQGAISGMIFVNNSSVARRQVFGLSKRYWTSRMKAFVWSSLWSAQFELGPISESSLGNVGQQRALDGKSKMTYVDLVITPTVGTGLLIAEDALDRFVLSNWVEKHPGNRMWVRVLRTLITPMKSFSNVLRGKLPWYRDYRH